MWVTSIPLSSSVSSTCTVYMYLFIVSRCMGNLIACKDHDSGDVA